MLLAVFLISTIQLAGPLVLSACGGFTSERSGVINIALEGNMLISAAVTAIVAFSTKSAILGVTAGVCSSVMTSSCHWLLTQIYRLDHVVSGMAINLFALGATNFLNQKATGVMSNGSMPKLARLEVAFGGQKTYISIYLLIAYLLPFALHYWMKNTRAGLRLCAVGNDPEKARLAGIKPVYVRLLSQLATGLFTGLSGAMIADSAGRFTDNMTAGMGYIALAALIMGGWMPVPAFLACLAFGAFEALQISLQGTHIAGISIPVQIWQSAPYLLAIVALAGAIKKTTPPYGLGKP